MSGTMYKNDVRPIVPLRVTWARPLVHVFVIPRATARAAAQRKPNGQGDAARRSKVP